VTSLQPPQPPPAQRSSGEAQLQSVAGRLNALQALDARDQKLNGLSQELTNMLFILFRSAGLYDLENQALDQAYDGMLKAVGSFYELTRSAVAMRVIEGNVFINRRQVKLDFSTFQNVRALVKIFAFLDINELSFEPELTRADLAALLRAFVRIVRDRQGSIRDEALEHIRPKKLKIGRVHKLLLADGLAERVCAWYAVALSDTRAFYLDAAEGRVPPFSMLKRVAQSLVDLPPSCAPLLSCLQLLAPEEARGSLTQQSVEAAGLCVSLSSALELGPEVTSTLAGAALQLYQGWTLIDHGIKVGERSGGERLLDLLETGAREGTLVEARQQLTRKMLELGGVNEAMIERVVMIYEAQSSSQRRATRRDAGRPSKASSGRELYTGGLTHGLLTDLVIGAHLFAQRRAERGPAEAARLLSASALSPLALKAFELALGPHPVASAVTLSDGGLALIYQTKHGAPTQLLRVQRREAKLEAGELLTLRPTSPIQISGEATLEPSLIAPLIFSHRSPH